MKKKVLICMLPFLFTLAGCAPKFEYTSEQSAATAEYMAGLLLRYTSSYSDKLLSDDELKEEEVADITVTPTKAPDQSSVKGNDNSDKGIGGNTETEEAVHKEVSLTELIGVPGFQLEYKDYSLEPFYPKNATNEVFSITARKGYQLAIVTFTLTNTSDAKGEIELTSPKYELNINENELYEPQLSLMENDLKYLNMKVAEGDSKTVLLIFEIKKDTNITSMILTATNDDKKSTTKIK